ncbi:TPA: Ubiquitin domain-containing protein ubfd1 [Trebouxia sp. C0004]
MFKLQFGKTCTELSLSLSAIVADLKQEAHRIPPAMQKMLIKGQMKPDGTTLQEAGIKRGLRGMLIGSRTSFQLLPPTLSPGLASDSPVFFEEDTVHTQTQHKKVRLTFKPKERQIWIGSAASTQKVYYSQIKKIESHVIEGEEEYSMVAFHLNEEGEGKYWLYWYPSQYTAALKVRTIGVSTVI